MSKATTKKCGKCGKKNDLSHFGENLNTEWCFNCNYWNQRLEEKSSLLIVDGWVYKPGPKRPKGTPYLGFAGRTFHYRKLGETEWKETNNMWGLGTVPEIWKDEFPDNAEFENVKRINFLAGSVYETCWDVEKV